MIGTKTRTCKKCGKDFIPFRQAQTRQYCYECYPQGSSLRSLIKEWSIEYKGGKC